MPFCRNQQNLYIFCNYGQNQRLSIIIIIVIITYLYSALYNHKTTLH
jgi:hypothetical protein